MWKSPTPSCPWLLNSSLVEVTGATLPEVVLEENCRVLVWKSGVVTAGYLTGGANGLTPSEGLSIYVTSLYDLLEIVPNVVAQCNTLHYFALNSTRDRFCWPGTVASVSRTEIFFAVGSNRLNPCCSLTFCTIAIARSLWTLCKLNASWNNEQNKKCQ